MSANYDIVVIIGFFWQFAIRMHGFQMDGV